MDYTKYIDRLKTRKYYQKLQSALKNDQLEDVILGENGLSLADASEPINQSTSLIIHYFHALCTDQFINRNLLNIGIKKLTPNEDNLSLILDYLYSYLLYIEKAELINLDVKTIWKRCKESEAYSARNPLMANLAKKIVDLLPETEPVKIEVDNIEDAIKYFFLSYIARIPTAPNKTTLDKFANNRLGLFLDLQPILNDLEKKKLIEIKNDKYYKTDTTEKYLNNIDLEQIFTMLDPKDEKQSFYLKYIEFLK